MDDIKQARRKREGREGEIGIVYHQPSLARQ